MLDKLILFGKLKGWLAVVPELNGTPNQELPGFIKI